MAYSCIRGPGSLRLCDPYNHRNVGIAFWKTYNNSSMILDLGFSSGKLLFSYYFSSLSIFPLSKPRLNIMESSMTWR